jgi:hypothetical protein
MARVTRELSAAWMREAVLVVDGAAPSRHFWSRWMDRALAPHAGALAARAPTPANDIDAAQEGDDPSHRDSAIGHQPTVIRD